MALNSLPYSIIVDAVVHWLTWLDPAFAMRTPDARRDEVKRLLDQWVIQCYTPPVDPPGETSGLTYILAELQKRHDNAERLEAQARSLGYDAIANYELGYADAMFVAICLLQDA